MEHNIEILTPRLLLRAPRLEDAREINKAMNENWHELQKWMSWSFDGQNTLEATQHYIGTIVPEQMKDGALAFFGFCRQTGAFVVASGIIVTNEKQETGYWLNPAFFGKAYAAEAANAVIRYAFLERNAKEFYINHYEGNTKSKKSYVLSASRNMPSTRKHMPVVWMGNCWMCMNISCAILPCCRRLRWNGGSDVLKA